MKKLVLIDTFNFLHRAYHALPKTFTNAQGEPTNAVYGVASMLISVLEELKPNYVLAAADDIAQTFRAEDFTAYKAHRKPMEDDLSSQIPKVFDIIDNFGINRLSLPGYEADDVIGTMVQKYQTDTEIIIVSNDRDLWQLVNENVLVMAPKNGSISEWIGPKEVRARFGFEPELIVDYKGLRGDPSDNIPGVFGIGEKTAKDLITQFGNMESIYSHISEVEPERIRKKLTENYEQAMLSKKLATIVRDAPLDIELSDCSYNVFNKVAAKEVLERYNFKSLIKRLGFDTASPKQKKPEVSDNQLSLL